MLLSMVIFKVVDILRLVLYNKNRSSNYYYIEGNFNYDKIQPPAWSNCSVSHRAHRSSKRWICLSALRQTHPNISLGTVYRNLGVLEENGQLMRIPMDNGSDRFDPNIVPHYHFLCRKCGCLQDVPMTALDSLNQLAQAHIDGIVESHSLLFKGVCKSCADTK